METDYLIKNREDLVKMFCENKQAPIGAEIGVYQGGFSNYILSNTNVYLLHSIDPWLDVNGNFCQDVYETAFDKLAEYKGRSRIIVQTSLKASEDFEDNSLDFVYIDGDHSYEGTKIDINEWTPKVKVGGYVGGHDYKNKGMAYSRFMWKSKRERGCCRVKQAVDEYVEENNYGLNLTAEPRCKSWFFMKDK